MRDHERVALYHELQNHESPLSDTKKAKLIRHNTCSCCGEHIYERHFLNQHLKICSIPKYSSCPKCQNFYKNCIFQVKPSSEPRNCLFHSCLDQPHRAGCAASGHPSLLNLLLIIINCKAIKNNFLFNRFPGNTLGPICCSKWWIGYLTRTTSTPLMSVFRELNTHELS